MLIFKKQNLKFIVSFQIIARTERMGTSRAAVWTILTTRTIRHALAKVCQTLVLTKVIIAIVSAVKKSIRALLVALLSFINCI